jgi:integrase
MPRKMTDKGVVALKPREKAYAIPDPELRGLWVKIQPSGTRSFWTITRNPAGRQIWTRVGPADAMGIDTARELARTMLTRVRAGLPAVEAKGETLGSVLDNWLKRHAEAKGLRSCRKIVSVFNRHITPEFRARELATIRRSDITVLLDRIEDSHGSRQADEMLTWIRSALNWHASRTDFIPPFARGMRRVDKNERARDRILNDDELRAVWKLAETWGAYGVLIRVLLVTAQRVDKVVTMKWTDISPMEWPSNEPPTWTLPTAPREKGNIAAVALPEMALAALAELPRYVNNPYVFAGRGGGHISPSGHPKRAFNAKLPADMPNFWLHDLRRTARSLMSRAGVPREYAERVLGHAVGPIESIYDRHKYIDEKSAALAKLAVLIDSIVNPRANVVPIVKSKAF